MLAMEEELRAFKTQKMIKQNMEEGYHTTGTPKSGTKFVYKTIPKPNEIYTDLEVPANGIKRAWHH
jgi:hypothetical protein